MTSVSSRLLSPHRVLGVVSDDVPMDVKTLGDEGFVTVSIGHAFQVFKVEHLRVVSVSQPMPRRITALASRAEQTYVACGSSIAVWDRMKHLATLGSHPGQVVSMLVLGDYLLSTCDAGCLKVWLVKRKELTARHKVVTEEKRDRAAAAKARKRRLAAMDAMDEDGAEGEEAGKGDDGEEEEEEEGVVEDGQFEPEYEIESLGKGKGGAGSFVPSVMVHPDTYVNKVVLGSTCGALALFNFRSGKRLHTFKSCAGAGGVTALAPSPALDVVAVGRADGTISLLHLRQDKLIFKLKAQVSY